MEAMTVLLIQHFLMQHTGAHEAWQKHNLKPHLTKTFKLSSDKHFVGKLYDIVK